MVEGPWGGGEGGGTAHGPYWRCDYGNTHLTGQSGSVFLF